MKFSFFEKNIFRKYTTIVALVASIVTFILSFLSFIEIDSFIIILILIIFLFVLVLTYPTLLIFSKRFQKISLIINQSDVEVSFGDIDFSSNGIIVWSGRRCNTRLISIFSKYIFNPVNT